MPGTLAVFGGRQHSEEAGWGLELVEDVHHRDQSLAGRGAVLGREDHLGGSLGQYRAIDAPTAIEAVATSLLQLGHDFLVLLLEVAVNRLV